MKRVAIDYLASEGRGVAIVAVIFMTILVAPSPVRFMPAWFWFSVDDITVMDAKFGDPIYMKVDRTISRPFRGDWTVTVARRGRSGFESYCTAQGFGVYDPARNLPDPLTLSWWMDRKDCLLTPGEYRVQTLWMVKPGGVPEKPVSKKSNVFRVIG